MMNVVFRSRWSAPLFGGLSLLLLGLGVGTLFAQPHEYTHDPGPLVWPCEPVRIAVAPDSTIVTVCPDGSVVTGGMRNPHDGRWVSNVGVARPAGSTPIQKLIVVGPDVLGFSTYGRDQWMLWRLYEGDR